MSQQSLALTFSEMDRALRRHGLDGERAFKAFLQCLASSAAADHAIRGNDNPERLFAAAKRAFQQALSDDDALLVPKETFLDVAAAMQRILEEEGRVDVLGFAYEYFFSDVFKGKTGKYFTPRTIVDFCISFAGIAEGEIVCDPTCGSGGFLARLSSTKASVVANDIDPLLCQATRLNLLLSGFQALSVYRGDVFDFGTALHRKHDGRIDVILANPPFSLRITDSRVLTTYEWARNQTAAWSDELFLEACSRLLRPGGRLVTVLPYSIVTNTEHAAFREWLSERWHELGTVMLPEGLFYPFGGSGARACIVALERSAKGSQERADSRHVLKAVVGQVGYDLKAKHFRPIEENDLEKIASSPEFERYLAELNERRVRGARRT